MSTPLCCTEMLKPGVKVTSLQVEQPDKRQLQLDLGSLADAALPPELCAIVSNASVQCKTYTHPDLPMDLSRQKLSQYKIPSKVQG